MIDTNKLRESLDSAITKVLQDRATVEAKKRPATEKKSVVKTEPTALFAEWTA